jgi:hypothetical protein
MDSHMRQVHELRDIDVARYGDEGLSVFAAKMWVIGVLG